MKYNVESHVPSFRESCAQERASLSSNREKREVGGKNRGNRWVIRERGYFGIDSRVAAGISAVPVIPRAGELAEPRQGGSDEETGTSDR